MNGTWYNIPSGASVELRDNGVFVNGELMAAEGAPEVKVMYTTVTIHAEVVGTVSVKSVSTVSVSCGSLSTLDCSSVTNAKVEGNVDVGTFNSCGVSVTGGVTRNASFNSCTNFNPRVAQPPSHRNRSRSPHSKAVVVSDDEDEDEGDFGE